MEKIINNIIKEIKSLLYNEIDNDKIITLYLKLGELLSNLDNISYHNWFEIEDKIKKEFGLMICFSRKNLSYMLHLYQYYCNTNIKQPYLDWNTYLS